jgi:hypothetical protein
MDSRDAEVRFREFAAGRGSMIENLSASEAVDLMAAFYRDVRADDCDLDADGDMLLFEWGVYEGLHGETFMYDITRQLVPEPVGDEEPHDFIGQLSLALEFPSSGAVGEITAGNRWCYRPAELDDFLAFVQECEATAAVEGLVPAGISVIYENVE